MCGHITATTEPRAAALSDEPDGIDLTTGVILERESVHRQAGEPHDARGYSSGRRLAVTSRSTKMTNVRLKRPIRRAHRWLFIEHEAPNEKTTDDSNACPGRTEHGASQDRANAPRGDRGRMPGKSRWRSVGRDLGQAITASAVS